MIKLQDLESKISTITEIYLCAVENYRFCYYLHYSDSVDERKYLNIDRHLIFIRHSLWRLTVIDICKLYSLRNSDKFDIRKLINSLKSEGQYRKLSIPTSLIQNWEDSINARIIVIENLNKIRDKIYAHTDPNKFAFSKIEILFSEVKDLLDLAKSFINDLSMQLNLPILLFDSPSFDSQKFEMVSILTKSYKDKIKFIKGSNP